MRTSASGTRDHAPIARSNTTRHTLEATRRADALAGAPADLSLDPVDVAFALEVLRQIVDEWPDRLPPDLHERATEAVERLESVPFAQGAQS